MAMIQPRSRLQQTFSHFQYPLPEQTQLSLVTGPTNVPLLNLTLGQLLVRQAETYGNLECLVFPWTRARWTYADLNDKADKVANGLLAMGVNKGDRIGIMAGNCEQYISVFFGVARVGGILVVLNNTYTTAELEFALSHTGLYTLTIYFKQLSADIGTRMPDFVPHSPNWPSLAGRNIG